MIIDKMSELRNEIDTLRQTLIEKEIKLVEEKYEDQLEKINAKLDELGSLFTYYSREIARMKIQLEEFLDDNKEPVKMIVSEKRPLSCFKPKYVSLLGVITAAAALYCGIRR